MESKPKETFSERSVKETLRERLELQKLVEQEVVSVLCHCSIYKETNLQHFGKYPFSLSRQERCHSHVCELMMELELIASYLMCSLHGKADISISQIGKLFL